jgi:hypothetical protein
VTIPDPAAPHQPVLTGADAPPENVQRGVALALIALPAGILVWDLLWTVGFIASLVAFGVAWGAMRLYRIGSNGPFSRTGAIAVLLITVVTLVLAYISGFAVDVMGPYMKATGGSVADGLVDGRFWRVVFVDLADPSHVPALLLTLLLGALGCFRILRAAFLSTRSTSDAPSRPAAEQPAPRLTQDDDPKS